MHQLIPWIRKFSLCSLSHARQKTILTMLTHATRFHSDMGCKQLQIWMGIQTVKVVSYTDSMREIFMFTQNKRNLRALTETETWHKHGRILNLWLRIIKNGHKGCGKWPMKYNVYAQRLVLLQQLLLVKVQRISAQAQRECNIWPLWGRRNIKEEVTGRKSVLEGHCFLT